MWNFLQGVGVGIGFVVLCGLSVVSHAATECNPDDEACVPLGEWQFSVGIGAGVRTNPLADGDRIPLIILPYISYQGEHFFIENLDLGLILAETQNQQFNLLITPSYDQVFFQRWDAGNFFIEPSSSPPPMGGGESPINNPNPNPNPNPDASDPGAAASWRNLHKRRMAGLAGFEYNLGLDSVDVQFHWLHDITRVHTGDEVRLVFAKPWLRNKHRVVASLGFSWQSEAVIQYYYGIDARELDDQGQYLAEDGVSTVVRMDWNYALNKHWDVRVLVSVRRLSSAISASPLVDDKNVVTAFVGGVYHF